MAREARTDKTVQKRTTRRTLGIATVGEPIRFTYRKADGSVSRRSGTVVDIQETGRGPRVWVEIDGTRKQFDPAYMTRAI